MSRFPAISGKSLSVCGLALFAWLGSAHAGFTPIYAFQGIKGGDGGNPYARLTADAAGNLFGTTEYGGTKCRGLQRGCGTIFKIAPDGTETVLHAFKGGTDGRLPLAGVIADSAGNLYGTTVAGGGGPCSGSAFIGCGSVFKLVPDGTETVLYPFCSMTNCADGSAPFGAVVVDKAGNLYGTTTAGGTPESSCGTNLGCGVVFKLAPDGTETVLYSFCSMSNCSDGSLPEGGLIVDGAGNLYGTTSFGGNASNSGTVFKLAPDGTETVLYSFCSKANCGDGWAPGAGLIADKAGDLYGVTGLGGNSACTDGCGTVFKLTPDGSESVLYAFSSYSDGYGPSAGVVADGAGNLYGTTPYGGSDLGQCFLKCGTVFKLAPDGTKTTLVRFHLGSDGIRPYAGLLLRNGHLFGTTYYSGSGRHGTVFELDK